MGQFGAELAISALMMVGFPSLSTAWDILISLAETTQMQSA
jgi:hypothetical protein